MPGDEEGSGEKCRKIAEGIAGKGTLSKGAKSELWLKIYRGLTARDLSVRKILSNRAWTEKRKTQLEKYAFTELKT